MLATDSYYCIGSGHTYCEDFADSGELKNVGWDQPMLPFGIISDGCSGGFAQVDIGARLLTKSLVKSLSQGHDDGGLIAAWTAQNAKEILGIEQNALYATLLSVRLINNLFKVDVFGDGVVVARKADTGALHIIQYDYQNAPFYLNYLLNNSLAVWEHHHSGLAIKREINLVDGKIEGEVNITRPHWKDCNLQFDSKEYDLVAVMSDGVETFYTPGETPPYGAPTKTSIPFTEIIHKLFNFKQYKGDFIRRRCNKFFKECAKEGIEHYDDFSIAAVYQERKKDV